MGPLMSGASRNWMLLVTHIIIDSMYESFHGLKITVNLSLRKFTFNFLGHPDSSSD